jgi:hypothetical protein
VLALATACPTSFLLEPTWTRVDLNARRIYMRNSGVEETP